MAAVSRIHRNREPKTPFRRKIMPLKSHWTLVFLIFTVSRCFADDDHEMEEFLKREYSLSKPYQGNATRIYTPLDRFQCVSSGSQRQAADVSRKRSYSDHTTATFELPSS